MDFLEAFADFYGSWSLDEVADRLGVSTVDLVTYIDGLIDDNYDDLSEEMSYNEEEQDEEED